MCIVTSGFVYSAAANRTMRSSYAKSKASANERIRVLAPSTYARDGVLLLAIHPGSVRTSMNKGGSVSAAVSAEGVRRACEGASGPALGVLTYDGHVLQWSDDGVRGPAIPSPSPHATHSAARSTVAAPPPSKPSKPSTSRPAHGGRVLAPSQHHPGCGVASSGGGAASLPLKARSNSQGMGNRLGWYLTVAAVGEALGRPAVYTSWFNAKLAGVGHANDRDYDFDRVSPPTAHIVHMLLRTHAFSAETVPTDGGAQ
jgi:hypothetical protein